NSPSGHERGSNWQGRWRACRTRIPYHASRPRAPCTYNPHADRMHLTISAVDLVVIGVYMAAVVLLGVWTGRGNRDLSDYLLGSRNLPWWALLGSIVATETNTATFLSVPGLAYNEGGDLRFLQLAFGYILGRILVARFLLPAYFAGN